MTCLEKWVNNYELLKDYYEKNGNIDIPRSYVIDGINIGAWLGHQRQAYKGQNNSTLCELQIKLLEKLKIKWEKRNESWDEYYSLLTEYYQLYKNSNVPYAYKMNGLEIGKWLKTQRNVYFNNSDNPLVKERIMLLNDLNVDWAPKKTKLLNRKITSEVKKEYDDILIERINHIIDDLVCEGINEIDSNNQDSIEKIMIKRIWR